MMVGDIQKISPVRVNESSPFSISSYTRRVTQQIHSLVQHKPSEIKDTLTFYVSYTVLQHKQHLADLNEIMSHGISDST